MPDPRSGKFRSLSVDDVVEELAREASLVPGALEADSTHGNKDLDNLSLDQLAERNRQIIAQRKATGIAPFSESEKTELRGANPFRRGPTFNLTRASAVAKRDPDFAKELERAAVAA